MNENLASHYPPLTPEEEHRERRIWTWIIIGSVIVTIAVLAFGWRFVEGRLEAAKRLDTLTATLAETDAAMGVVDAAVTAPLDPGTAQRVRDGEMRVSDTKAILAGVADSLAAEKEHLNEDEQRKANLALTVVTMRLAALGAAESALADALSASETTATAGGSLATESASAYRAARDKALEAYTALKEL
ncbi:MAG: hypothetical protein HGB10_10930 [Coriobacteriia bacterium]|nr:hypothetical protein [Coriobacteriia bacterium]